MAEGVNGGPPRSYRRRSLAEQREAYQIASAEVAVLKAKAEQITADAEVRISKLELQILKLKQQEAKAAARKRFRPDNNHQSVALGSRPRPCPCIRTEEPILMRRVWTRPVTVALGYTLTSPFMEAVLQDILSFVQVHSRSKREDLAGEALALLLREDPGQAVLRTLLQVSPSLGGDIEVVTRRTAEGCIPDVHLIHQGHTIGLLELKFWASLTRHQLSGRYFEVAPQVIFIVPKKRKLAVQEELSELALTHALRVLSWDTVLELMDASSAEPTTRDERLFTGALEHLKEFCNVIEQEHFVPFTTEQLCNPLPDASTQHLVWLTREVLASAASSELVTVSGRLGAGFDSFFFYGQNVILNGFRVWLGYWPHAWKQHSSSGPLWVQIYGSDATVLRQTGAFGNGLRTLGNDLVFPFAHCGFRWSEHAGG